MVMRKLVLASALVASLVGGMSATVVAGETDPLFINLTSDDVQRVTMALSFGGNQAKQGHALTVFLNDRGVLAASKVTAAKFAEQQKTLETLLGAGAKIYVCPLCMKHYGVKEEDLLPGLTVANPDLMGKALFADGTKTLSW